MYHDQSPFVVYCTECYFSDSWNGDEFARDYDFSRPFFSQWYDLLKSVPRLHLEHVGNNGVGCEYANYVYKSTHVYLSFVCVKSEHVAYSALSRSSKNCSDCYSIMENQYCYECTGSSQSYKSAFLTDCSQCADSEFLFDCINCQDCFMSVNLRNKRYIFYGIQMDRDSYKQALEETKKQKTLPVLRAEYAQLMEHAIHPYTRKRNAVDSTGNLLRNVKNVRDSFEITESENCRFATFGSFGVKDSYDVVSSGKAEQCYECIESGRGNFNAYFSYNFGDTHDIFYSHDCNNTHSIFGCVGLNAKPYSILNKQYTKEEYGEMVENIKKQMAREPYKDTKGKIYAFGEFFPSEFSPFAYNETNAFERFPLTKEEALEKGYTWRDNTPKENTPTVTHEQAQNKKLDDLTKEILACTTINNNPLCSKAFRLVEDEILLLKHFRYPVPPHCPNCRYLTRRNRTLPYKLWRRSCMCDIQNHDHSGICPNEFETSYSPDRPEKVYCESCYQKEVL